MNTPAKSLPVDTLVLTYGFGAEPVRAVILSYRSDGYIVGREGDTSVTQTITNEDIVSVVSNPAQQRLEQAAPDLLAEAIELLKNATYQDGQAIVLTQDCEALQAAIAKATNA